MLMKFYSIPVMATVLCITACGGDSNSNEPALVAINDIGSDTASVDAGIEQDAVIAADSPDTNARSPQPDATTKLDGAVVPDTPDDSPDVGTDPDVGSSTYGYDSRKAVIWHIDPNPNTEEGFHYGCLNNECIPATLVGNRYERSAQGFGGTVTAFWQMYGVEPNPTPSYTFSGPGGNASPGAPIGGGGNAPTCSELDCLDWTSNSLLSDKDDGPPPRANAPKALPTPENGAQPNSHGFAFDIVGNTLTWRWGTQIIKGQGDSSLEMHCSEDNTMTYKKVVISSGTATIPCSGTYDYFFRYLHPTHSLNNDPAHQWIYTGPFTTASRVDVTAYPSFTDGSSNWMRFRHPVSHDGVTAAILDAQHNNDRLRNLDRYLIWVDDAPNNVQLGLTLNGSVIRNESMRNTAGGPNGQQFFAVNQNPGFGNLYSYGQVIQFELTAVAGATGAQTYNDFSYYTVGLGWGNYGDRRLNPAGRAGTTMILSDSGAYSELEKNAIFTQPLTTLYSEEDVDDFILGHHLFHGVDPNVTRSSEFDVVKIGTRTCGDCHFRDGRGFEIIDTDKGPRLPPPTYGVGLLEAIQNRESGFAWDGSADTVDAQVEAALIADHGIQPGDLPGRVLELLKHYTKVLTVPARNPGSYDDPEVVRGDILFNQIGCDDCHTPIQITSSSDPAYDNLEIRPYTDMKNWNMNGGSFRTPPLWGLGHNIELLERNGRALLFMHDGAATSVDEAIQQHSADGAVVRSRYNALSSADREAIIKFVRTL